MLLLNAAGIFLAARLAIVSIRQTARLFLASWQATARFRFFSLTPSANCSYTRSKKNPRKKRKCLRRFPPPFFTPSLHVASLNVRSVPPSVPFSSKGFFTPPWENSFSQVLGEWGGGGRPGARFCLCRDRYLPDPVGADGGGGGRKSFKRVLNGAKKEEEARRMGNDGHAAAASSSKSGGGVTLREVLFRNKEEEDLFGGEK